MIKMTHPHTTLEVMEGTVACQLKNPDGTMNEEIVMVTKRRFSTG